MEKNINVPAVATEEKRAHLWKVEERKVGSIMSGQGEKKRWTINGEETLYTLSDIVRKCFKIGEEGEIK